MILSSSFSAAGTLRRGFLRTAAAAAWPMPPARSRAAGRVAELFGIGDAASAGFDAPPPPPSPEVPLPTRGQIVLLTGPSGGGKSTLLRQLADRTADTHAIDVARIRLRRVPCVDQVAPRGRIEDRLPLAMGLLARVGLAEARAYLSLPHELSDGQRWRLRLAVALARVMSLHARGEGALLVADEFCAVLDRVSAAVVARGLRRQLDRLCRAGVNVSAVVATSHDDLRAALLPDVTVHCDFGTVDVECRVGGKRVA